MGIYYLRTRGALGFLLFRRITKACLNKKHIKFLVTIVSMQYPYDAETRAVGIQHIPPRSIMYQRHLVGIEELRQQLINNSHPFSVFRLHQA